MTDATARTVANAVLASAGAAAAYLLMTQPRWRRLALHGLRLWLGASVPAYLLNEVRRAWVASAQRA
jgi:hypothetical protein